MKLTMPNGEPLNSAMTKRGRDKAISEALDLLGNAIKHHEPWEVVERRFHQVNVLVSHRLMADGLGTISR